MSLKRLLEFLNINTCSDKNMAKSHSTTRTAAKNTKNSKTKEDIFVSKKTNCDVMPKKEHTVTLFEQESEITINSRNKMADFELVDGLRLQVKPEEVGLWNEQTKQVGRLDSQQKESLKTVLVAIDKERPLTRKEISTCIEEIQKSSRKPQKYRQAGHLVDEKLKYSTTEQLSFWDLLTPETKQKIEESKIEVKAEGIKLTPPENKLVHALNRLLHEKSQNKDPTGDNYYGGNLPFETVPYGVDKLPTKAPVLKFRPAELYKAYMCSDEYSGHDIKFIHQTLHQLETKKVLIKYDRIKKVYINKKQETLTDRIEAFESLIKVISFIPDLTDEEKHKLDRGDKSIRQAKAEIVIALNPIFTDQIGTKYIEFPEDTNRRLVIAAGGHNKVTSSMNILMEYLLREISNKRYKAEINDDRLPYLLGLDKYIMQNRKRLIKERIDKDIQAIINIGIIVSVERVPNSTGSEKWVFTLNTDYT